MCQSGLCVAKTRWARSWFRCQKASHKMCWVWCGIGVSGFLPLSREGAIDSNVMIGCLDIIAQSVEKETVVVLDNSPIHRSEEFAEKIKEWAKLGLKIYFLPAYCPSLNKIEMLWDKIKCDWLSWDAYSSYKNLCQEPDKVLSQIGSLYHITFA